MIFTHLMFSVFCNLVLEINDFRQQSLILIEVSFIGSQIRTEFILLNCILWKYKSNENILKDI